MPDITLSDDELRDAAQAARIGARQAERDADAQLNPRIKQTLIDSVRRYTALGERFENARSRLTTSPS